MALFRRNKSANSPALPEEVNDYYQAEKRDRTWMAWLLALMSLAVTTLLIMALFFGGRWVYRKIRPGNTPSAPIAGNQTNESPASVPEGGANNSAGNNQTDQEKAKEEQKKKEEEEKRKEQERARVNAPANPTTPNSHAPGAATGPATTTTPNTNSDLPGTGPGDVIAIFVLTSVAGALVHRYVLRQTNS